MVVNERTTFSQVLKGKRDAEKLLAKFGIHSCRECPAIELDTIEAGAMSHGCDLRALIKALNELPDAK